MANSLQPEEYFEVDYDPTDPASVRERIDVHGERTPPVEELLTATAETLAAAAETMYNSTLESGRTTSTEHALPYPPREFSVWHPNTRDRENESVGAYLIITMALDMRMEENITLGDTQYDEYAWDGVDTRVDGRLEKTRGGMFGYYAD